MKTVDEIVAEIERHITLLKERATSEEGALHDAWQTKEVTWSQLQYFVRFIRGEE